MPRPKDSSRFMPYTHKAKTGKKNQNSRYYERLYKHIEHFECEDAKSVNKGYLDTSDVYKELGEA